VSDSEAHTRVKLPQGAEGPFGVFVSGVPQTEGEDYVIRDGYVWFTRRLDREGKLGFWRWTSIFLGLVGTYRPNDIVDVHYTLAGRDQVATALPHEP
jgi:hypothetical protein